MTTSHRMLVRDVSADPYDLLPLDKKKREVWVWSRVPLVSLLVVILHLLASLEFQLPADFGSPLQNRDRDSSFRSIFILLLLFQTAQAVSDLFSVWEIQTYDQPERSMKSSDLESRWRHPSTILLRGTPKSLPGRSVAPTIWRIPSVPRILAGQDC